MIQELEMIVDFLEGHRINYCLAGGTAVVHYGAGRGTDDFDFFVAVETYELGELLNLMIKELPITEYVDSYKSLLKVFVNNQEVDIIPYITKEELRALNKARYINLDGIECRMIRLEDLILLKISISDTEERHSDDVIMLCESCCDIIDTEYLLDGIYNLGMERYKEYLEELLGYKL